MVYTSFPDSAVFCVNGRTVASPIEWEDGEGVLPITGEKLQDVVKRVDSATFFLNGERVGEGSAAF